MAFIGGAFAMAATRSSLSSSYAISALSSPTRSYFFSSQFRRNVRPIESICLLSKKLSIRTESSSVVGDIEDSSDFTSTEKRVRWNQSLLHQFRRKKGLSVTDITATEWCEKQMEFVLLFGKPKATDAMKAATARHAKLEEEVMPKHPHPLGSALVNDTMGAI